MLLKKIVKNLPTEIKNFKISGLAVDSKKVKKGNIFFAIKGNKFNGENFIEEAIKKGSRVIVCSSTSRYINKKVLVIKTADIKSYLSYVCSKFYFLKPKNIIAVTGTNGKTSVADLFYQILTLNSIPVASIGTLGIKYKGKKIKTSLTSPDTISLHQFLEKIKKNKVENVIIETSSHGLHQKRINNLELKAGIFTNFSQDHLDYHKSMNEYLNAKLILFNKLLGEKKTIITDKSIKEFLILKKISKKRNLKLIDISKIKEKLNKYSDLKFNDFQKKNLSMAIAAAKICHLNEKRIYKVINKLKETDGRLELVKTFPKNIKVYVDFAHTPDALKNVLRELKKIHKEKITLVFGCGGDRDTKKRSLMAKVANTNCEKIYVTDDNPRNESPEKIREEIIKYINVKKYRNIGNRSKAIKLSILNAQPNEVILVAGKGHEAEQIYKNKVISISDKKIIKKLKLKKNNLRVKDSNFLQNQKILQIIDKKIKKVDFQGLAIDSRVVKKDNLFLTFKGKKQNGSKFVKQALKKGAKCIVSSQKIRINRKKIIKVKNEFIFLKDFAKLKRSFSTAKILAVTGSAGKTSLKNLLFKLLNIYEKTFASPKSYNNQYGVPLSLSQINSNHKYAIFEIGMSKPKEIYNLSKIVRPNLGVITNIGEAHIENFKNLKGIADAKGEIIENISKNGSIILNRDDKYFYYLRNKAKLKNLKVVSFGIRSDSDIYPIKIIKHNKTNKLIIKDKDQFLSLEYKGLNIYNVLAAIAVLRELNLDLNKIKNTLKECEPSDGRGKVYKIKRNKKVFNLIDESYNANPLSVKNAIKNLNSIKKQNFKKYLILGDMLELGKKSENLHKDLSKVINNSDIDKVFIKGNKTLVTYKNIKKNKRGNILQLDEDIDFILNNIIASNDYLMIKGSNATGLNDLSKRIIKGN